MMVSWVVLALVFSGFLALFLVAPYFDPALAVESEGSDVGGKQAIRDSKERALRAIKDLEFDRSMGKVSEEDFSRAKEELLREAAAILEETRGRA